VFRKRLRNLDSLVCGLLVCSLSGLCIYSFWLLVFGLFGTIIRVDPISISGRGRHVQTVIELSTCQHDGTSYVHFVAEKTAKNHHDIIIVFSIMFVY
jgi:hypothetical protein